MLLKKAERRYNLTAADYARLAAFRQALRRIGPALKHVLGAAAKGEVHE